MSSDEHFCDPADYEPIETEPAFTPAPHYYTRWPQSLFWHTQSINLADDGFGNLQQVDWRAGGRAFEWIYNAGFFTSHNLEFIFGYAQQGYAQTGHR